MVREVTIETAVLNRLIHLPTGARSPKAAINVEVVGYFLIQVYPYLCHYRLYGSKLANLLSMHSCIRS